MVTTRGRGRQRDRPPALAGVALTFADFDLLPTLQASLAEQGFTIPTEIQGRALPELLAGRSVVGIAETGSGKTLTYVLPVLQVTKTLEAGGHPVTVDGRPRALVLVPSRELGEQVAKVFKTFTHDTRVRVRTVLGGTSMEVARRNVKGPFEVLVATAGRLLQLLGDGGVSLDDVRLLVLDEADQMLDMGFLPDVATVVGAAPAKRQMALFSATIPPTVEALIGQLFHHPPIQVRTVGSHRLVPTLETLNIQVLNGRRFEHLERLLAERTEGGTLIFANTREQCDKLAAELTDAGHPFAVYRGEMDKAERRANLQRFRDGEVPFLIATDLGSRGLDVESVGRVINYHLPHEFQNYLHRAGRTARAGRAGLVINFVTERDAKLMARIERAAPKGSPRRR
jgi:ATP-dependent RNA helicase RhlE